MLIRSLLLNLGGFASIVVAVLLTADLSNVLDEVWKWAVVLGAAGIALALGIYDTVASVKAGVTRIGPFRQDARIRSYMERLIRSEGRCAVSSNNLSWVSGPAETALFDKARNKELTLLLPYATDLSRQLVDAGATAHYYGAVVPALKSRFTVANVGRSDAFVAVGRRNEKTHVIERFSNKGHPGYSMALDLFDVLSKIAPSSSEQK